MGQRSLLSQMNLLVLIFLSPMPARAEGTEVLAVAENVTVADFKTVAGQFSYETEEYILNPDTETNKANT